VCECRKAHPNAPFEKAEMVFVELRIDEMAAYAKAHKDVDKPVSHLCALWKDVRHAKSNIASYKTQSNENLLYIYILSIWG
jgi:hypothetical protein